MNYFYEITTPLKGESALWESELVGKKNIKLFVGDKKFDAEIGRFEALLIMDDGNCISKMEYNFMLRVPGFSATCPAEIICTNLPVDLFHRVKAYEYKMSLTNVNDIDKIGGCYKFFGDQHQKDKPYVIGTSLEGIPGSKLYLEDLLPGNRKNPLISLNGEYETIDLPFNNKIRCSQFTDIAETWQYKNEVWLFKFSIAMPKMYNQIVYNNLSNCEVKKFHTGSGDNK